MVSFHSLKKKRCYLIVLLTVMNTQNLMTVNSLSNNLNIQSTSTKTRLKAVLKDKMTTPLKKIPNYWTGQIGSDERVVFFPTTAHKLNDTHWNIPIHGWIFEPELDSLKRKALIKTAGKMLFKVTTEEEKVILKRRLQTFTVDNQSMKYVNIRFISDTESTNESGRKIYRMPRSSKDGHFKTNLTITKEELSPYLMCGNKDVNSTTSILKFEAIEDGDTEKEEGFQQKERRVFGGVVHMIPPEGISVISDIDDTVKHTNYLNKSEFYKNTFTREFQVVPGMSQVYQNLQQSQLGMGNDVAFHYVSASPYQLYEELAKFLIDEEKFPPATFHLKQIRIKDKTLLEFWKCPIEYKLKQIEPLLEKYPNRKFLLVGDSGEKDPEIYAELYKKYPTQIQKIYIRNVNNSTDERMKNLIPKKLTDDDHNNRIWEYFTDGTDLVL